MFGGRVGRVSTVHEYQPLEVIAAADMTVGVVRHVHRHELPERGKPRQLRQSRVIHVPAAHREAAQRRHLRQGAEAPASQVVAPAPPDVFDGSRPAQRHEPVIAGDGVLTHEEAEPRHRGDGRHRLVGRVEGQQSQVRQGHQVGQTRGRDREPAVGQVERKQAVESCEAGEPPVREPAPETQRVGLRVG